MAERLTVNQEGVGSSPTSSASLFSDGELFVVVILIMGLAIAVLFG